MPWLSSLFLYTYEFFHLRFNITLYQASWCHIPQTTILAGKAVSSIFTAMRLSFIPNVSTMAPITKLTHVSADTPRRLLSTLFHFYIIIVAIHCDLKLLGAMRINHYFNIDTSSVPNNATHV